MKSSQKVKFSKKSTEALRLYYPEVHEEVDLQDSLIRFIDFASSSGKQDQLSLRALRPAYMLHGEAHHETWVVDFNATMVFRQYLHSLLVISDNTHTAISGGPNVAPGTHDADVRTTVFDSELANYLGTLDCVEVAFQEHRRYSGSPNIHPPTSPGEDLEIDLPLNVGSVFVPIQTTTSVLDIGYEEGDHEVFLRRWRFVKDKLRDTDRKYANKLVEDPTSNEFLRSTGITHVLPIICTPFPEPVVSTRESYWLRSLPEELQNAVSGEGFRILQDQSQILPRILTPTELYEFLKTASKAELKKKAWIV